MTCLSLNTPPEQSVNYRTNTMLMTKTVITFTGLVTFLWTYLILLWIFFRFFAYFTTITSVHPSPPQGGGWTTGSTHPPCQVGGTDDIFHPLAPIAMNLARWCSSSIILCRFIDSILSRIDSLFQTLASLLWIEASSPPKSDVVNQ